MWFLGVQLSPPALPERTGLQAGPQIFTLERHLPSRASLEHSCQPEEVVSSGLQGSRECWAGVLWNLTGEVWLESEEKLILGRDQVRVLPEAPQKAVTHAEAPRHPPPAPLPSTPLPGGPALPSPPFHQPRSQRGLASLDSGECSPLTRAPLALEEYIISDVTSLG